MNNEITNEELARLKKLAESASAGPWYSQHHRVCDEEGTDICGVASTRGKYEYERANRDFIATVNPAFVLALIDKVESLARDNLELTRRYEEQKLQEKRLEVALQRAKVGHDPELSKAIEEVLYHNQVNGVFTSLTDAIERLAKIAKVK